MKIYKVIVIHNMNNMFHLHTLSVVTAEMKIVPRRFALKPIVSNPYLMQTSLPLQYVRTVVPTMLMTWFSLKGLFFAFTCGDHMLMVFRNLTLFSSSIRKIVLIFSGSLWTFYGMGVIAKNVLKCRILILQFKNVLVSFLFCM